MRKNTKIKASRLLTSTLMSSDLTPKELMEVCESFMGSDEFVHELGYHLKNLVESTMYSKRYDHHQLHNEYDVEVEVEDDVDYILSLIKSRRITKDRYIDVLRNLDSGLADYFKSQRLTFKAMILLTIEHMATELVQELIKILNNDEYLDHILNKVN